MANSQFTVYRSSDVGAPILNGNSGSLVNVLNGILVTGYGSKTAAGWTADFTSSTTSGSTYRPPSGSRLYLSVQDDAIFTSKEARIRGFEVSTSVYTGSGLFPVAQGAAPPSNGYLVVRKSATTGSSISVGWIAYADAHTLYFYSSTLDSAGVYYGFYFGDIYSFKTTGTDDYKTIIVGGTVESATTPGVLTLDGSNTTAQWGAGHYLARTYGGGGGGINAGKHGVNSLVWANSGVALYGNLPAPSLINNGMWMSPIYVNEYAAACTRGRLRGQYYIPSTIASFSDGEIFSGSNEYAGKIFQIVKQGSSNGMYCIEISNTVETN